VAAPGCGGAATTSLLCSHLPSGAAMLLPCAAGDVACAVLLLHPLMFSLPCFCTATLLDASKPGEKAVGAGGKKARPLRRSSEVPAGV